MAKKSNKWGYAPILLEVGFEISIPLVVFVILGVWLDNKFHTPHLFLFGGIFISLISSTMALYDTYKKVRREEGIEE
jgi:hypothetical protein